MTLRGVSSETTGWGRGLSPRAPMSGDEDGDVCPHDAFICNSDFWCQHDECFCSTLVAVIPLSFKNFSTVLSANKSIPA